LHPRFQMNIKYKNNTMKNLKFSIIMLLMISAVAVSAQKKVTKIAVINSQELLDKMPEYDSIQSVYEKEYREIEQAMQQMYTDLQQKQEYYVANVDSMTPFMASMKKQEIQDLTTRLQGFEQNAQQQLQQTIQRLQQPLIDKIKKAIEDVAKENGYTHVIDLAQGSLLYFDESFDIMDLVKKKLNIQDTPATPAPAGGN
jgi:outer membrane protein